MTVKPLLILKSSYIPSLHKNSFVIMLYSQLPDRVSSSACLKICCCCFIESSSVFFRSVILLSVISSNVTIKNSPAFFAMARSVVAGERRIAPFDFRFARENFSRLTRRSRKGHFKYDCRSWLIRSKTIKIAGCALALAWRC